MGLWLSKEELVELSGYRGRTKQKLALGKMGLTFRSRPFDGLPLVDRSQFEGEVISPQNKRRRAEPSWDAIAPRKV